MELMNLDSWGSKKFLVGAALVAVVVAGGVYLFIGNKPPEGEESSTGSKKGPLTVEEKKELIKKLQYSGVQLSIDEQAELLEREAERRAANANESGEPSAQQ